MWEARNGKWPDKLAATPTTETPTDLWSDTKAATHTCNHIRIRLQHPLCSPHYTQMFPVYTWAATKSDPTKVCLCSYHYQRSKTTNHCVKVLITATHLSEWKQKMSHNTRTKLLWKVWHPTPYSLPRCLTTLASLQWLAELQGTSKAQLSVSLLYTEACPPRRITTKNKNGKTTKWQAYLLAKTKNTTHNNNN